VQRSRPTFTELAEEDSDEFIPRPSRNILPGLGKRPRGSFDSDSKEDTTDSGKPKTRQVSVLRVEDGSYD
jgi:hypothetical protein